MHAKALPNFPKLEANPYHIHSEGRKTIATIACYMKDHYNMVGGRMFKYKWKHIKLA